MRRTISSLIPLVVAGCSFGFSSPGLLSKETRTVAVPSCLNDTADPTLTLLVTQAVNQAMVSRLSLRSATEEQADIVVRCRVVRYEPDAPTSILGNPAAAGTAAQVTVLRREVEMTVELQVVEQKTGHILWDGRSIGMLPGQYDPGREGDGKQRALDLLVKKLIDGVHSSW